MATIKRQYGLIGYPLGHSYSQRFFTEKFRSEHIDAEYLNFEIEDIGDLMELIAEHPELQGFNVTIPYKEQIIPYLTDIDETARAIGAVNTVKLLDMPDSPRLVGYNTDTIGFTKSLLPYITLPMKSLILGTGGAAKAVAYSLSKLGIPYTFVSRTPKEGRLTYADLTAETIAEHRLIVNATPLGMYPKVDAAPDIPYEALSNDNICYDLIYNPAETEFLRRAALHNATTISGLAMLHLQAIAAWDIWNSPSV